MDIAGIVTIIAAVFAAVSAWFALKAKRSDFQSKMLADCQKAYDHKCQECNEAWGMVDKRDAEIDALQRQLARKDAENAELRQETARREMESGKRRPKMG